MIIDKYIIGDYRNDKRTKLSPEQKKDIRKLYSTGEWSQRQLAREFDVSKRLVQFILDPKKLARAVELHDSKKYYKGGKDWRDTMRRHREHKKILLLEGKLKKKGEK